MNSDKVRFTDVYDVKDIRAYRKCLDEGLMKEQILGLIRAIYLIQNLSGDSPASSEM